MSRLPSPAALAVLAVFLGGCGSSRGSADPPSAPAPVAPLPPPFPPASIPARDLVICVVENGALRHVAVQYNAQTGDSTYRGRLFSEAFPATYGYAAGASWYIGNELISVGDHRYVKFGRPRILGIDEVTRVGDYHDVPVFVEHGAPATAEVVYVPVRPGCEFQQYQLDLRTSSVRGD